jgi:hypothetical protein
MPTQKEMESDIRQTIEDEENAHRIDPTKNVLDLVKAESRYQDGMRDIGEKLQHSENHRLADLQSAEAKRLEDLAKAETRRVDALEEQRVRYEARIAEDLRVNVKTTSDQLAGQLIKETGALNNQIATLTTSVANQVTTLTTSLTNQMTAQSSGINTRLADLERFRWETGGKSAVADPALTLALSQMTEQIASLKDVATRGVGRQEQTVDQKTNYSLILGWIVAAAAIIGLLLKWH